MSDHDEHASEPAPGGQSTPSTHGQPPPPPPTAPEPDAAEQTTTGHGYGDAGRRLLARIIDSLIVGIPLWILLVGIARLEATGALYTIITTLAGFGYFVYFETSTGATLGKKLLNMQVVDGTGTTPITTEGSFRRNWWMLLGLLSFVPIVGWLASIASLGIAIAIGVTISSDRQNQGFHDKMATTYVTRTS